MHVLERIREMCSRRILFGAFIYCWPRLILVSGGRTNSATCPHWMVQLRSGISPLSRKRFGCFGLLSSMVVSRCRSASWSLTLLVYSVLCLHTNVVLSRRRRCVQVLNAAIFPRPEYDLPIFCADFFSTSSRNIIVL